MPGYTSQRRGTVRTLPNQWTVLFFVLFCVDCVVLCIVLCRLCCSMYRLCVNAYYCHRVSNQLQLNIIHLSLVAHPLLQSNGLTSLHACIFRYSVHIWNHLRQRSIKKGSKTCKIRIGLARIITGVVWTEINQNLQPTNQPNPWSAALLERLRFFSFSKNFPYFMRPASSLPYSQDTANCPSLSHINPVHGPPPLVFRSLIFRRVRKTAKGDY